MTAPTGTRHPLKTVLLVLLAIVAMPVLLVIFVASVTGARR